MIIPSRIAGSSSSPFAIAFSAPTIPYSPSTTASAISITVPIRCIVPAAKKTIAAPASAVVRYQGLSSETGSWLSRTSRIMPPPIPVTIASATTPATSKPRTTASSAPDIAPTKTASRSSASGVWTISTTPRSVPAPVGSRPMDFESQGLLEGVEGASARAERVALLQRLLADGVGVDELRRAAAEDRLALLQVERTLGTEQYTPREVAALAGVPLELVLRLRQALGLPKPGPTTAS